MPKTLCLLSAICESEGVDFQRDERGTIVLKLKTEMIPSVTVSFLDTPSVEEIEKQVQEALSIIEERIVSYLVNTTFA